MNKNQKNKENNMINWVSRIYHKLLKSIDKRKNFFFLYKLTKKEVILAAVLANTIKIYLSEHIMPTRSQKNLIFY
ncbi:hypothetical protein BAY65_04015 [Campylobacter lari]|nr:hypothetical protein [Campylobacter lari]